MNLCISVLLSALATSSVLCEPKLRWTLLGEGEPTQGTTFEIQNEETMQTQNLRILQSPCNCEDMMCRCCAGFNFDMINFRREGCMIFGFNPMEFSLDMMIMMNDEMVWNNSLSGKNPPPICMPVPLPALAAMRMEMCMRLYDIYFPGQNIHLCMDMEPRMQGAPLMVLHFDCMRMGMDGWALMKPGETVQMVEAEDEDNVYDTVSEMAIDTLSMVDDMTSGALESAIFGEPPAAGAIRPSDSSPETRN